MKNAGAAFCDDSAQQVVDLLLKECELGNVTVRLRSNVLSVEKATRALCYTLMI